MGLLGNGAGPKNGPNEVALLLGESGASTRGYMQSLSPEILSLAINLSSEKRILDEYAAAEQTREVQARWRKNNPEKQFPRAKKDHTETIQRAIDKRKVRIKSGPEHAKERMEAHLQD